MLNYIKKMINEREVLDMSDRVERAKQLAGQNFKDGYNCAEAIVRAYRDLCNFNLGDDTLKIAAGFGGGIGHAGCVCGALNASIMVLGLLRGRLDRSESRDPMYTCAEGFHQRFFERFGATCCRVLNPHPFDTKEHLRNCLKITGITAGMLMEYIEENGLSKPELNK